MQICNTEPSHGLSVARRGKAYLEASIGKWLGYHSKGWGTMTTPEIKPGHQVVVASHQENTVGMMKINIQSIPCDNMDEET